MTEVHRCVPPLKPLAGQRWRCPACSSRFVAWLRRGFDPEEPGAVEWIDDLDQLLI